MADDLISGDSVLPYLTSASDIKTNDVNKDIE